jgi:hypothetical protein
MTVREVALEVIRLAEERDSEDTAAECDRDEDGASRSLSEALRELAAGPPPAARNLRDYLKSIRPDVLAKLRTLMYVGRGDGDD